MSDVIKVSEHLLSIGVSITPEEIQFLLLHQYKQQQTWKRKLYKFSFIPSIHNWKIVTTIAFAAVGLFLAPVLGIGAVVAALVGASIGWKLSSILFPDKKKMLENNQKQQEKLTANPGFDSAPEPPSIGGVIPMIFAKYGGVQVTGNVIFSRYEIINNGQNLYLIISLGLGKIKNVNYYKLLLNGQNVFKNFRENFDVTWQYTNGDNNAVILNSQGLNFGYDAYSQAITPNTNNNFGLSYIGKFNIANATQFIVTDPELISSFNYFDRYRLFRNYQSMDFIEFRATDINNISGTITVEIIDRNNPGLVLNSFDNNSLFYTSYKTSYESLKKCVNLELMFNLELYGVDNQSNYINHGIFVYASIDSDFVGHWFYEVNKKPGILKRFLKVGNLSYNFHKITLSCHIWNDVANNPKRLGSNGSEVVVNPSINVGGSNVIFLVESTTNELTLSQIFDATVPKERSIQYSQLSSDRGSVGKFIGVNERVRNTDINQSALSIFSKQVLALIKVRTSDRISGQVPTFTHNVDEGLVGKVITSYGECSQGTTGTIIYCNALVSIPNWDTAHNGIGTPYLVNIRLNRAINIASFSGNIINLGADSFLRVGEKFYTYYEDALSYFPDVYVHTLINSLGGLGKIVGDKFIDFASIIKSKIFCMVNNFYFDDIISQSINWNEWANNQSIASTLLPTKYAGAYGLIPEQVSEPVGIFTVSNIIKGDFKEGSAERVKTNAIQLTYRAKEGDNYYQKTIVVMTSAAYNNIEAYYPESITFDSITNQNQAIRVAQVALKTRIIQDKIVEFYTGIQGFFLREGDLIVVQYGLTESESETSGFCLSTTPLFNTGYQEVLLSASIRNSYSNDYILNVYHMETGNIQKNLNFSVGDGKLLITGLTEEIKPPTNGYPGDVIIINNNFNSKIFRVSSIDPEPYKVKVTAIYWNADMLNSNGLITVGI